MQQMQANLWSLAAANINMPISQTATSCSTPLLPNPPQQHSPMMATDAISPASLHILQQLQAVGLQQQILQGMQGDNNISFLCFLFLIIFAYPFHLSFENHLNEVINSTLFPCFVTLQV